MTQTEARAELDRTLSAGYPLMIVTNQASGAANAAGDPYPLSDPRSCVCHAVIAIEDEPNGVVRASSAEGDWTLGQPLAVLRRLTEYQRAVEAG